MKTRLSRSIPPAGGPEIDALLHSLKVEIPLPENFQHEVWRRIALSQENSPAARVSHWMEGLFSVLIRPLPAAAAVITMVSAGVWMGEREGETEQSGKSAYVQSVSPFVHSRLEGER